MADKDAFILRADGLHVLRAEVDLPGYLLIGKTFTESQAKDLAVPRMMDLLIDEYQHIAVLVLRHSYLQIKCRHYPLWMSGGSLFGGSIFD